ncbi:hypothetical protein [Ramlibacter humi]|uniref:hypothetical protein n=1 Tax=Ramlibacter humi TaxID=2530451 RepID=UPI0014303B19|nr:hypothetical protein [Ramlibacter humi]
MNLMPDVPARNAVKNAFLESRPVAFPDTALPALLFKCLLGAAAVLLLAWQRFMPA